MNSILIFIISLAGNGYITKALPDDLHKTPPMGWTSWNAFFTYFNEEKMIEQAIALHSLIRGVLIQSCSTGAKNFTKYVFFHVQFNGLVKHSQNHCTISVKILKNDFLLYKID